MLVLKVGDVPEQNVSTSKVRWNKSPLRDPFHIESPGQNMAIGRVPVYQLIKDHRDIFHAEKQIL
jgi:hypothetical protein